MNMPISRYTDLSEREGEQLLPNDTTGDSAPASTRRGIFKFAASAVAAGLSLPLVEGGPAHAQEKASSLPDMHGNGFYRFAVGSFKATVISDGYADIPAWPGFAPNAAETDVNSLLAANFLSANLHFSNTVLFVDTGTHRILVDSGFGEKLGPLFGNYSYLQANLRRAGISPDSIDLVIISHGHVDHIAGLLNDKGSLAYPNARLAFVDQEWDYWKGSRFESEINGSLWPDGFKVAQVATVKTVLPTVESRLIRIKAGGEIVPGVHYVAAPGHSPAHSAILFESGGQQLMYLADVAHHPVTSLQRPEWTPVVDYDAALSVKTRRALLDRVATDRSLVMNYHFPFPAIGHVVRDKDAYRWEATQWVW